jgi:hypothetical protein
MTHFVGEMTGRIAPSTHYGARASREANRDLHEHRTPGLMMILHILGVAALVVASVTAIADQSERFVSGQEIVGVHEIPAFIAGRVELTPGLAPESPTLDVGGRPAGLSPYQRRAEQG